MRGAVLDEGFVCLTVGTGVHKTGLGTEVVVDEGFVYEQKEFTKLVLRQGWLLMRGSCA